MTPRKEKKSTSNEDEAASKLSDSESPAPVDAPVALSRERFAALEKAGQHSSDLMIVINGEGTVIYANPVALQTFGKSLEEGIGLNALDYHHPSVTRSSP
jgi:PAS domain-containing protein